jgi:hypothetical protein
MKKENESNNDTDSSSFESENGSIEVKNKLSNQSNLSNLNENGEIGEHSFYKKGFGRHQVFALIEIVQVSNVDTVAQTFDCRFRLELEWMCTEADYNNRKKEEFTPIWSPGLPTLPTLVKEEKLELEGRAQIYRRREMFVLKQNYVIDGTFSETFELENYPFDSQEFPIKVLWPKPDMALHPAMKREFLKFNVAKMALGEWDFSGPMIEISTRKEKIVTEDFKTRSVDYPMLTVSLRAMRVYKTTVINIYIILALITFAGIGAFCLDIDEGGDRLSHASTVLLATVAFLYIIESSLPKLMYMTITDYFVFFGTVFVLIITIEIAILSFIITHLGKTISNATDNVILICNLALWLSYVGGFSSLIYFRILPRELQHYAAPGRDRCVCNSKLEDELEGDVDFSLGSNVAVVPKDGVHQYYWELNRDHERTFVPTWISNDYGRDWNEYFQAYLELSPSKEGARDYERRQNKKKLKFELPPFEYICLKLLKITGDQNIPAGYISVQTRKEKISPKSLRSAKSLAISTKTKAEIQVRYDIHDHRPSAFTFEPFEDFHMDKNKMTMTMGGFYTMHWHALDDVEADEVDSNYYDFLEESG